MIYDLNLKQITYLISRKRNEPISRAINTQRLRGITIYGGICQVTGTFIWVLHHGTNVEGWKLFLTELKRHADEHYVTGSRIIVTD